MNYSLNNLIAELESAIEKMEMKGFDTTYDTHWYGYSSFDFEFEDCFVHIEGNVYKSFDTGRDLESQNMDIHKAEIQHEDGDPKYISFVDVKIIEESIRS
jgi:hypothetical protein